MNTNTNAIFNRIEVLFYSSLISCMGEVRKIRIQIDDLFTGPKTVSEQSSSEVIQAVEVPPQKAVSINWHYLSQALFTNAIWIILGFATGLLMGMIKPG